MQQRDAARLTLVEKITEEGEKRTSFAFPCERFG